MKPYSERTRAILGQASLIAKEMGHSYIGSEHILLAIAQDEHSIGCAALKLMCVNHAMLRSCIKKLLKEG